MPQRDDIYDSNSTDDVSQRVDETSDANYTYIGLIPRGEIDPSNTALADAAPVCHITRYSKNDPGNIESASNRYDQVWDDRATLTTYR